MLHHCGARRILTGEIDNSQMAVGWAEQAPRLILSSLRQTPGLFLFDSAQGYKICLSGQLANRVHFDNRSPYISGAKHTCMARACKMKRLKLILACSLGINLAFVALGAFLVFKRGGISYLKRRDMSSSTQTQPPVPYVDSNMYRGRESTFAALPERQGEIIFIGDSIIDFCQWNELLQRPDVLNRGIAADTLEGVGRRIGEALRHRPRKLFLMIGINNLLSGDNPERVITGLRALVQTIKESAPQTQIFVHSILPINRTLLGLDETQGVRENILQVNGALRELADGKQVIYVDLYSIMADASHELSDRYTFDGLHLNGDGYLKWRDVIRPLVNER